MAVKTWLVEHERGLADEIFLDLDPHTGIRLGQRWKQALHQANTRCEAVICLLSQHWELSAECKTECRHAEDKNKAIICARLEPIKSNEIISYWQYCDIFPGNGPTTGIDIGDGAEPVVLATDGLQRLLDGLRALGIGAEHFPWPPANDPERSPYRGWRPLDEADAAVFFGRDAQIVLGLDALRRMRNSGYESLFVILGPSGVGKSSFLRAGVLPRLRRDDRNFVPVPIVRPERAVLSGELGLAQAIRDLRASLGLNEPVLGEIKNACHPDHVEQVRGWLEEARRTARLRLLDVSEDQPAPTLVLPVDQGEELFNADAGPEAAPFLELLASLAQQDSGSALAIIVAVTIRTDRYEPLQIAHQLAGVHRVVFDELKPLPPAGYKEVITGPARRATQAGRRLTIEPALVERLLDEAAEGADALPLLALTLERLHRDYGSHGDLTVAQYESMGGMAQVVQHEVDSVLAARPEQRQAQLRVLHDAFIPWLATINPQNDQPIRRLARWDSLPTASQPYIQAMIERRLLVKDTRGGQVVLEVALESLLRQWRELAAWLRDEAEDLKAADNLEREAADWRARDRKGEWLLRGTRLDDAETLAAKPRFRERLNPTRDYLVASRQSDINRVEAEKRRREAELAAARENQRAAEALAAAESRARREAEHHTVVLQRLLCEATGLRLVSEAQSMLAGARPGGRVRAFQQLLAGRRLAQSDDGHLVNALVKTVTLVKVADAGSPVLSVAFSPDGTRLASGTLDHRVRLWDAATGQSVGKPLTGHTGRVNSVLFSHDGTQIFSGSSDNTIRLWDTATGQQVGQPLTGHTGSVTSVAINPDGTRIVSGSSDNTIRLWDAATGQQVGQPLTAHTLGGVFSVAFSPDGTLLASAGSSVGTDNTVRLWNPATRQPVGQPLTGHSAAVWSVTFSPDGTLLASASSDNTVRLWNPTTGQPVGQPLTGHTRELRSVAFSPDGTLLASASSDYTVRLWNPTTGQPVGQPLTGHTGPVFTAVFSPEGSRLASAGHDETVQLWIPDAAQPGRPLTGHADAVWSVVFSSDGSMCASGSGDRTVRLWDPATGQPVRDPLTGHTGLVTSVAFSPDGSRLASASFDYTLRLWDPATGQPVRNPLRGHTDAVLSVAFSPDGTLLASASRDHTLRLWDPTTGQPVRNPLRGHTDAVLSVAFSPDGTLLASASRDHTVRLWDPTTGQPVRNPLTSHTNAVQGVAFSPDGTRLATASYDNTIQLWNPATGARIGAPLTGHTNAVLDVAFSPDGARLASAGYDHTLRLWDSSTGQSIGDPLTGHTNIVWSVAFSPDGSLLASASGDETVRLWPVFRDPASALCAKLNTNMSHKQWRDWVSPDIDYIKVCPALPIASD